MIIIKKKTLLTEKAMDKHCMVCWCPTNATTIEKKDFYFHFLSLFPLILKALVLDDNQQNLASTFEMGPILISTPQA